MSRVLIVGDGNFSFSVAYNTKHPSVCLCCSSLLSETNCYKLHPVSAHNVQQLRDAGVQVLFEVDGTQLHADGSSTQGHKYDLIMFNFPHTGGKSKIERNRQLLKDFFASAIHILALEGCIQMTLAQGQGGTAADATIREWHDSWQVVTAASYAGLILTDVTDFDVQQYPYYVSTGFRSEDRSFYTVGALTYTFRRGLSLTTCPDTLSQCVNIDGQEYKVPTHLASKLNRDLLAKDSHPLSLVRNKVLEQPSFTSQFPNTRPTPCETTVIQTTTDRLPSDVYELTRTEPSTEATTKSYLRASMLPALHDQLSGSDLDKGVLYYTSGDIYVRRPVGSIQGALGHQLAGVIHMDSSDGASLQDMVHKWLLEGMAQPTEAKVDIRPATDIPASVNNMIDSEDAVCYELTYTSHTHHLSKSCNQVKATGPATVQNCKGPKHVELTLPVAITGKALWPNSPGVTHCFLMDLDALASVYYDISDVRLLHRNDDAGLCCHGNQQYTPLGLYPPLWRHDVSFWQSDTREFSEQELLDVIYSVCGDSVRQVLLMNRWSEPCTGRVSLCYRVIYQSHCHAVSHRLAHHIQDRVREAVGEQLEVTIR